MAWRAMPLRQGGLISSKNSVVSIVITQMSHRSGMVGLIAVACVASVLLSRAAEGFTLATASPAELRSMVKQLMSSKRGKPRHRHHHLPPLLRHAR